MPHFQYSADGKIQRYPIVRNLTSIGSSPDCHLVLRGPEIAATHCTLIHEPGRYRLESTQRANVFFVNNKKQRQHDLRHGDAVVIGGHELVFSAVDAPAPSRDDNEID